MFPHDQTINNSLFLRALRREPTTRTPIWFMRQAGRYLPEYREVRSKMPEFMDLCRNKEMACEVALQPLRRFELDAAILFSDILTIPDAMGLGLYFQKGEGPCFRFPLHTATAIEALTMPEAGSLNYVMDAVRLIRQEIPSHLPLIGFSGSPWTLACYMVEGKSQHEFQRMKALIREEASLSLLLLQKLTLAVTDYLSSQVEAGANALMIFDTWGGILSTEDYHQFSLNNMQAIVSALKEKHPTIPIILFTKNGGAWLQSLAKTGCDGLSLDWTVDLKAARKAIGSKVALQGNLDPSVLLTNEKNIREKVKAVLEAYGPGSGHIFNLGHGITPEVPVENVHAMVNAVHEFSPLYHIE